MCNEIVWRFRRRAARANLHCGGRFHTGVGCIRLAVRVLDIDRRRNADTHADASLLAATSRAELITDARFGEATLDNMFFSGNSV